MAKDPSRRRALAVLAGAGATGALATVALPAARLVAGPAAASSGDRPWIAVARLADLAEGQPTRVRVIADLHDGYATARQQPLGQVWLVRAGAAIKAFTATCPHLGCTVDAAPDGKHFFCPCHTSWFDLDGKKTEGKPNKSLRGLDALPVRLTAEKVIEVQFLRFQTGTASAEVLGLWRAGSRKGWGSGSSWMDGSTRPRGPPPGPGPSPWPSACAWRWRRPPGRPSAPSTRRPGRGPGPACSSRNSSTRGAGWSARCTRSPRRAP